MKSQTIKEMLENSYNNYPNNIAFYEKVNNTYEGITYKQLYEDVIAFSNSLVKQGLEGKNIAVIGKNSYEWAVAYLATMNGLGTIVPLDKELTKEELEKSLNRLEIGALVYSKDQAHKIDDSKYNTIKMETEMYEMIEEGKKYGNLLKNKKVDPKETKVLLFTSGTTSESKIVMLSNENIMYNINTSHQYAHVDETDRFYSVLPMHHTLEGTGGFLLPLERGASVIHLDNLKNVSKDIKTMKPTIIIGVPRVIDLFDKKIVKEIEKKGKTKLVKYATMIGNVVPPLKKRLFKDIYEGLGGKLKTIIVGGAPANPNAIKRLKGYGFNIIEGYGLTECAPLVAANSKKYFKLGSVGKKLNGTDVKIVNQNDDGVGEIAVKGPQVFNGYYENEEATNNAFDKDGYFLTGDLAFMDKKGYIDIKGRSKNVIITSNGKNVYPEEIEEIIKENDTIRQAVVSQKDNKIVVDLVLREDIIEKMKNNPKINEEVTKIIKEYIHEVNERISDYKRIQKIEFREVPFEETSTLKIKRK